MKMTYDPTTDVLRIALPSRDPHPLRPAGGARLPFGDACIDFDGDGTITAFEVMGASRRYPHEMLHGGAMTTPG